MTDGLNLPDPDSTLDVWGDQLNDAIELVNDKVGQAEARIDALEASSGSTVGTVPLAMLGAINGVATLDGGGQIPLSQTGNISPTSIGAANLQHQHTLADIPDIARTLRGTPAFIIYNTTTSQWPTSRASVTTDVLRPVIWFGGTALPADAIPAVDAWIKTDANQLVVTAAGAGTTTPPPSSGTITLAAPSVTVNGSAYNISALFTNGSTAKTFTYIQLAVRGPGGSPNADTGYNNNVTLAAGATLTLTGSGNATATGAWTVRISYSADGTTWVDGPTTTFTIASLGGGTTPPPAGDTGSRTIPLIGRSGLAWNSGVFRNAGSLTSANEFAAFRGRPLDSITYFTGRTNQTDFNQLRSDLNSWPGYRIICVPSQVASRGNYGTNSSDQAFWANWGTLAKNQGWNDGRTIVRLNWEANGDWYPWAWVNGGASLFVTTYMNTVNAIRSTAPKMLFNLTMNRNNVNGGVNWKTQIYQPLLNHFDIIGLDSYDDWPNQSTDSGFTSALANDPGFTSIAAFCRANGKMMWFDEWGPSHRPDAGSAAGGDDPYYISRMYQLMAANADVVAGETFYEDRGTNGQDGNLMADDKGASRNPNSIIEYRKTTRWGNQ
jgi:hypothetical protein